MTYIKVNLKNYYYLKYKERILIINCQNYEFINIILNKTNGISLYNYVKILILNNPFYNVENLSNHEILQQIGLLLKANLKQYEKNLSCYFIIYFIKLTILMVKES